METCKGCGTSYQRLLQHIARTEKCKKKYGNAEFEALKAASKQRSKRAYNDQNRAIINAKQVRYDAQHREEKQISNAEHWKKNRDSLMQKRTLKRDNLLPSDRILDFKNSIIDGPNYVCLSCKRCLFKKSVKILSDTQEETLIGKTGIDFYQTIISHNNTISCPIFCHSCFTTVSKSTPSKPRKRKLHVSNGLYLNPVPPELKLTELEQQLIALVQIFMKIKKLPKSMMAAVVDKVINVPMELQDIEKTIHSLPRPLDEAEIVAIKFSHAITCKIIQFPLKLAWASTAHSMQGVTVKQGSKVVVHFHKKFKPGMAYVMLSRCERLQDLFITGDFTIDKIKCNPQALEDFIRLSESFQSTLLQRQKELGCLRISFLNVMNIWPHLEDIKQSSLLMSSTVLGLAETWMEPGTTVDFPNFQAIFESIGSGKGLAAFFKEDVTTLQISKPKLSSIKVSILAIDVIFLYLSHGVVWTDVKSILENWLNTDAPTAVIGDMNWHWKEDSTHPMKHFMEGKGLKQMMRNPTHDQGNCIDHLYLNQELLDLQPKVEAHSAYFSDHDIITVSFPEINLVN